MFFPIVCGWIDLKFGEDLQVDLLYFYLLFLPHLSPQLLLQLLVSSGFLSILTKGNHCIGRRKSKEEQQIFTA
jgi:hypothetical protein